MTFEPEIIGFCCSWSGVHNSKTFTDPKGKERDFKAELYPVECVGALPTFLVLESIEKGIDGILIASCAKENCQYFDGDEKIATRMGMMEALLEDMGLEPERIAFEKVSDRSGEQFDKALDSFVESIKELGPNPMKEQVNMEKGITFWPPKDPDEGKTVEGLFDRAKAMGVLQCLECGKCTASCPVSKVKSEFSPMYVVEKALRSLDEELGHTKEVWNCLTCASCSYKCPSDVDFVEFVRFLRDQETVQGEMCTHGGMIQAIARHHSVKENVQDRLGWVTDGLKVAETGDVLFFTGCLSYFDAIFEDIGFKGTDEIAKETLKVLNAAGITPVVLADERCCGHDEFWNGHKGTFEKLAAINAEKFKAAGVKTIVTACPECTRTFKLDYPKSVDFDFEVKHITEFITDLIEQGKLEFKDNGEKLQVSYQDPCRLARHMDVVDQPRKILEAMPGVELVEMARNRENAMCCGTSAWVNCNALSERMRAERLRECLDTGSTNLVTSCPKCQIHFKCTMSAKPDTRGIDKPIQVTDIVTLVSQNMKGA